MFRAVHGVVALGAGRVDALLCFGGLDNGCGVTRDGVDGGFAFGVGKEAEVGVAVEAAARAGPVLMGCPPCCSL